MPRNAKLVIFLHKPVGALMLGWGRIFHPAKATATTGFLGCKFLDGRPGRAVCADGGLKYSGVKKDRAPR